MRFLQNLAWGRVSKIRNITPNFTVVSLKMWAKNRENSEGPQKNLNIDAQLQTFLHAMTHHCFENNTATAS